MDHVEKWLLALACAIAGAIPGAIAGSLLMHGFPFFLTRLVGGWWPGKARLRGTWLTKFDYPRDGSIKTDDPQFYIKQVGAWITGFGRSSVDNSTYRIRGKFAESRVITGEWEEQTAAGKHYHGAFHLMLAPLLDSAKGQWIGFSRDGTVKNGSWDWTKTVADKPLQM